jgi:hypothetical protein
MDGRRRAAVAYARRRGTESGLQANSSALGHEEGVVYVAALRTST